MTFAVFTSQLGTVSETFIRRHVEDIRPKETVAVARYASHPLGGRWTAPCPTLFLDRATLTALPAGTAEALGTALAALAAVACLGQALDTEMVQHGIGAGEPWSLGAAAAVAAVAFGLALRRALRRAAPA